MTDGCRAELLTLPSNVLRDTVLHYEAIVSPRVAAYCDRMRGPQPAVCVRELHPDAEYHWDGKGTWWQGDHRLYR